MKTCKGLGGNRRVWGLPPEKIIQITTPTVSESALLQNRVQIAFLNNLYVEEEQLFLTCFY